MRRLRHILADCAGAAAVEFALVLPIAVSLFCGTFEVTNLVVAYMKVTNVADTVAELVAQTGINQTLHAADIDDIYKAGQLIMTPADGTGLKVAVASVLFDATTGIASLKWQQTRGNATAMTNLPATVTTLGLGGKGDDVIVAEASYTYTSIIGYVLQTPITVTRRVYGRPRLVPEVKYT
jgi:Flp pilus assembly protein TadG